jgi:hypothetical protein
MWQETPSGSSGTDRSLRQWILKLKSTSDEVPGIIRFQMRHQVELVEFDLEGIEKGMPTNQEETVAFCEADGLFESCTDNV